MTDTMTDPPPATTDADVSPFHDKLEALIKEVEAFGAEVPEITERVRAFAARVHDEFDAVATKMDRKVNP
jgi:hypothetical protein